MKVKKVKVEWGGESCNLGMSLEEISIEKKRKKKEKKEEKKKKKENRKDKEEGIMELEE